MWPNTLTCNLTEIFRFYNPTVKWFHLQHFTFSVNVCDNNGSWMIYPNYLNNWSIVKSVEHNQHYHCDVSLHFSWKHYNNSISDSSEKPCFSRNQKVLFAIIQDWIAQWNGSLSSPSCNIENIFVPFSWAGTSFWSLVHVRLSTILEEYSFM